MAGAIVHVRRGIARTSQWGCRKRLMMELNPSIGVQDSRALTISTIHGLPTSHYKTLNMAQGAFASDDSTGSVSLHARREAPTANEALAFTKEMSTQREQLQFLAVKSGHPLPSTGSPLTPLPLSSPSLQYSTLERCKLRKRSDSFSTLRFGCLAKSTEEGGHSMLRSFSGQKNSFGNTAILSSAQPASANGATWHSREATDGVRESARGGSIDPREVAKFSSLADAWWDERGPHRGLHEMNPTRVSFIRSAFCRHFGRDSDSAKPLEGLRLLDVGCGGGLLCEPLARLGAQVTGVDATEKNIRVAALHASRDPQTSSIEYLCVTAEQLVETGQTYDAVLSLEVIEHVATPVEFMQSLGDLCRPGGALVLSTINRTMRSYALAIGAAEYLLRMLPVGTHNWSRFVTPQEMALLMRHNAHAPVTEAAGMVYNPLTRAWSLADDMGVNYIVFGEKPENISD
eukprot:TRINITY_DN825_c0_g1_i3.p1 TRINITY_DN825_c0_g1~~TRINITY_DN825_c0_g1_i3.p1  ORF type:complete len:459 (-),score=45.42 TRINITY_DN825_c0_g1_i3:774-2150(-)